MRSPRIASLVSLVAVVSMTLTACTSGRSAFTPAETDGVHYLVYSADGVLSDAVAYTGVFEMDSEGCVVVSIEDPAQQYRAAFPTKVGVSQRGIVPDSDTTHSFGVPIVVGRASPEGADNVDASAWPVCERDLEVFAVLFS